MAELSFGHNLRAKRKEVINNTLNFLPWAQGCFTACGPTGFNSLETLAPANTVNFNNAPAKMLGIALHEYGSPYQFKVQLCNLPREIRDFEVLVQVQTVSVNPTDCKLRSGSLSQLYPLSLPVLLGCDFSGIIVKAGSAVPFKVGQKIFGRQTLDRIREVHGTYAEYCVADYHEIAEMPEEASFEQAAAVPWAGLTAYAALVRVGGISYKNSTGGRRAVLILGGSGGVGTFAVQIAKHYLRCHTTVTCSSSNAEMMEKIGADEIVNYNDVNFWDKISKPILGQGKVGYNVVLDCVGGDDYWQACQPLLVEDGSYVTLVGAERYGGEEKSEPV
uniref:Enoyl reductase (ER) domain-containing protein n=1 Tax=Guillardia theta TaxID=55529 RepID=A0A7S4JGL7_GUITH|mmetsp:Transcript_16263/g.54492  ORF Transcript_16263/g.54492 Transcript_16263/m.54492 type:complete len:332 (+) Transcript_16263:48-1043(+)